jgi:hypothetical protein
VKIKFEKPMKFEEDFVEQINKAIETSTSNDEDFKVKYHNGYLPQDSRSLKNVLIRFKVVYAKFKDFHI